MRDNPRTTFQRGMVTLEIISAIKKRTSDTIIGELCAAAEITLAGPREYLNLKFREIDALIDAANGVPHEIFVSKQHETSIKKLRKHT